MRAGHFHAAIFLLNTRHIGCVAGVIEPAATPRMPCGHQKKMTESPRCRRSAGSNSASSASSAVNLPFEVRSTFSPDASAGRSSERSEGSVVNGVV